MSGKVDAPSPWVCRPLDSYEEVIYFPHKIPGWHSLCTELKPSSSLAIKNEDVDSTAHVRDTNCLETAKAFCHFKPESDEPKRHELKSLPKTLVCHDMANGYHDDSNIEGTTNHDAYTFYNWSGIDIFCYFSHHLVTIPPLAWINVGHDHGVKVIGTLITEWTHGGYFWDKILATPASYREFADALVFIAKTLRFDGWLLNIENKIHQPATLLQFVEYFHQSLHRELPYPVLIWYDSVTIEGNLSWQNGLSEKNRAFFDACDGIFTNYSWTEQMLQDTVVNAAECATDVYVGIDVWGRNFFGGGQFNTQQAVKLAHKYGLSLAIFAPAWTHEALDPHDNSGLDIYHQFLLRDRAFWGSIWPYLNTRLPTTLPFHTSFCRGRGKKRRLYGEVLCPGPWYNLRHQQYQPNANHGPHGYLLSTIERLIGISPCVKTEKGIIKYRMSFMAEMKKQSPANASPSPENADDENHRKDPIANIRTPHELTLGDRVRNFFRSAKKHKEVAHSDPAHSAPNDKAEATTSSKANSTDATIVHFTESQELDRKVSLTESSPSLPTVFKGTTYPSVINLSSGINLDFGKSLDKKRFALAAVPDELQCTELYDEDSFTGGSCLKIHPSDPVTPEHRCIRLFHCDFQIEKVLIACVVTKNLQEKQKLDIELRLSDRTDHMRKIILCGSEVGNAMHSKDRAIYPLHETSKVFRQVQRYLMLQDSGCYIPIENSYQWNVRYYAVSCPDHNLTSINCRTEDAEIPILLGHLGLCPMTEDLVEEDGHS